MNEGIHITSAIKEDLIKEWKVAASSMSYYNAAEGDWQKEKEQREECRKYFQGCTKKLVETCGMTYEEIEKMADKFLVSNSDWRERV